MKIAFVVLIAIVVCIGFVFVVFYPNRNLSLIDIKKNIASHAIQYPFIATLDNTFGIVSSEPGLPYYPLYRVSDVSKLYGTSIYGVTGIYFTIVNHFEDKHHKYSSVWFYSYKEKKLYRLLETREKEYWLDSFRFNPDILELNHIKDSDQAISVLFDVSKKEFIPLPTELSNNTTTVTFTSVSTLAILSQYDTTTELYTYYSWDFQQNICTKIGVGESNVKKLTDDGSFLLFDNPLKHCMYAFNCQTGATTEIPWISESMTWSQWPETKRLYFCHGMDTWYDDFQKGSARPYIEILELENMKKETIEFPIHTGELYQEKLVFHGYLIFGVVNGDSEKLLTLDSTYAWNHFYTLQSLPLVNDQISPSYWYKSVDWLMRTISREAVAYPLTFKLTYENCTEEETRRDTLLFDHNFQCVKELTKEERVKSMYRGSWIITTKVGPTSCDTVQCFLEQDTVYEFLLPDPGTTYRFTKKEIEKSLADKDYDKPFIYDDYFSHGLSTQRKYAVYECKVLEDIEKNGIDGNLSKELFFILSFEDSKIYSNGTKPNLEFEFWIDHG